MANSITAWMFICFATMASSSPTMTSNDPGCVPVDPAWNYKNSLYAGHWHEVGRFQTAGGDAFQKDCWCDQLDFVTDYPDVGDGNVTYSCRKNGPHGELQEATADLFYDGVPGHFKQRFQFPLAPKLDYTIIFIDEDTAIEYDCTSTFGITNYCIHFMARDTFIEEVKLFDMIAFAENLGLNNQNLTYKATRQEGCRQS
ncbi:uncharacterized protein [Palaemon carinicauda]|uniref:uncharacterized protein n=1 Tax=Palaemon carinicauda TaxID=392227 RepID=UPI0035B64B41